MPVSVLFSPPLNDDDDAQNYTESVRVSDKKKVDVVKKVFPKFHSAKTSLAADYYTAAA